MTDIAIRRAKEADLPELYRLLQAKAEFDGAADALIASQSDLGAAVFCENPPCDFLVADSGAGLVGFAAFYPVFSTFAAKPGLWMDDLFVEENTRSRGIGRAILVELAAEASRRDCCKLEWSLDKANTRGIAFYEREGAVVREGNRFAKLDTVAMDRLLSTRVGE